MNSVFRTSSQGDINKYALIFSINKKNYFVDTSKTTSYVRNSSFSGSVIRSRETPFVNKLDFAVELVTSDSGVLNIHINALNLSYDTKIETNKMAWNMDDDYIYIYLRKTHQSEYVDITVNSIYDNLLTIHPETHFVKNESEMTGFIEYKKDFLIPLPRIFDGSFNNSLTFKLKNYTHSFLISFQGTGNEHCGTYIVNGYGSNVSNSKITALVQGEALSFTIDTSLNEITFKPRNATLIQYTMISLIGSPMNASNITVS